MAGMLPTRLDWVVRLRGVAALSVFAIHLWKTSGAADISVTAVVARATYCTEAISEPRNSGITWFCR